MIVNMKILGDNQDKNNNSVGTWWNKMYFLIVNKKRNHINCNTSGLFKFVLLIVTIIW